MSNFNIPSPFSDYEFSNGLKYRDIVLYKKVRCALLFDMGLGKPINIKLLPISSKDKITRYAGTAKQIPEADVLKLKKA